MEERVLEIRTYRILDGERDEFGRRASAVVPMLRRHGVEVVGHGPSIDDAEHYVLLRSFASRPSGTSGSAPSRRATSGAPGRARGSWS